MKALGSFKITPLKVYVNMYVNMYVKLSVKLQVKLQVKLIELHPYKVADSYSQPFCPATEA